MEKNNKEQQRFIDIEKAKRGKWQCPTCGQMCTKSKEWKVSADGKPLPVLIYRCSSSVIIRMHSRCHMPLLQLPLHDVVKEGRKGERITQWWKK